MAGKLVDVPTNEDVEELDVADSVDEREQTETQGEDLKLANPDDRAGGGGLADDIPEKYKGKSFKDLIQMHQEAEKAIGRQGSEVGELRKLVDEHIRRELENRQPTPEPEEEKVDWFADPDKALEQRLNNHPKIKQAEAESQALRQRTAIETLKSKHPDMESLLKDDEFGRWVQASQGRTKQFLRANQEFDVDAADDLFSTWKELQAARSTATRVDKEIQKEQVKVASTGAARGTNPPARKKKYHASDIRNLRIKDPERYNQMADEFLLAYREGRVIR